MVEPHLVFSLLTFVVGLVLVIALSAFQKRYRAYTELVRIRANLTRLVLDDQRINYLYPPTYITGDLPSLNVPLKRDKSASSSWLALTDSDLAVVKSQLKNRIEWAVSRTPKFAEALRYTTEKSGKMVRSQLIFLLGRILDINLSEKKTAKLVQLAQVIELEHAASLLHDDVVDDSDLRRGIPSHRKKFGDRNAVLTGDNLISVLVEILTTEIGEIKVTELIANSIEGLVIGELLQLIPNAVPSSPVDSDSSSQIQDEILPRKFSFSSNSKEIESRIRMYLKKSYFKTASLFACLGQCVAHLIDPSHSQNLGAFGFYFGVAFQLVDDMLDLAFLENSESSSETADKPVGGSDIKNGTVTLPVLFAAMDSVNLSESERKKLLEMISRRFSGKSDFESAVQLVKKSDGLKKSRQLISVYFGYCRFLLEERIAPQQTQYRDAMLNLLIEFENRRS